MDSFVDATDVGGKDRETFPHGFEDTDGKGFPVGDEKEDVGLSEERWNAGALLEKLDAGCEIVVRGEALHGRQERARTSKAELPVQVRQIGKSFEESGVILLLIEAGDHRKDDVLLKCTRCGRMVGDAVVDRGDGAGLERKHLKRELTFSVTDRDDACAEGERKAFQGETESNRLAGSAVDEG